MFCVITKAFFSVERPQFTAKGILHFKKQTTKRQLRLAEGEMKK